MTTEKTTQITPELEQETAIETEKTIKKANAKEQASSELLAENEGENTDDAKLVDKVDVKDAVKEDTAEAKEDQTSIEEQKKAMETESEAEKKADDKENELEESLQDSTLDDDDDGEEDDEDDEDEGDEEEDSIDFSDEDAELDGDAPEYELDEESEEEKEEEQKKEASKDRFDLTGKSKNELLDIFAKLLKDKPVQSIRRDVEAIKTAFYKQHRADVELLRKKFVEDGGQANEFTPPADDAEQKLKDLFGEYRKQRNAFISNLDKQKDDNLEAKLKIIEELKELINSSETMHVTFNAFRELQRRWREAGPVPQTSVKDLWDTYNHHVENFYSYIKINKELRDLDLKRNYEAKVELCEEAEALILDPSVVSAFHQLQKLHQQWRETGPVAKEYKDSLWERFREASARINKQHQEFFENLKAEQERNLKLKTELCSQAEELASAVLTTRREWNRASKKLLEIQKVWKTIGFAPRKDNTKIYERFRKACDKFFEQKRVFFLQLKKEMEHNLELKTELCKSAEAVQESSDWRKTTGELIAMQKRWKEIGPVTRRHSDAVWKRFRAACDHFFNKRAEHYAERDAVYEKNLELKQGLLVEIEQANIEEGGFDMVKEFQRRWSEIGFVPYKKKDVIQKEYKVAMDKAFSTLRNTGQLRSMDRFKDKVQGMKGGDRRLRNERDRLFNRVKQLEADIALLENNIGFFAKSKNADAMIKDVRIKIDKARKEMEQAIDKINLIDKQEDQ